MRDTLCIAPREATVTAAELAAGYALPYEKRQQQTFLAGQVVSVGPRYVAGGAYESDGWEGLYVVEARVGALEYQLTPAAHPRRGRADVVARVTRLQLVPLATESERTALLTQRRVEREAWEAAKAACAQRLAEAHHHRAPAPLLKALSATTRRVQRQLERALAREALVELQVVTQ
jgi:hypothetical protein